MFHGVHTAQQLCGYQLSVLSLRSILLSSSSTEEKTKSPFKPDFVYFFQHIRYCSGMYLPALLTSLVALPAVNLASSCSGYRGTRAHLYHELLASSLQDHTVAPGSTETLGTIQLSLLVMLIHESNSKQNGPSPPYRQLLNADSGCFKDFRITQSYLKWLSDNLLKGRFINIYIQSSVAQ